MGFFIQTAIHTHKRNLDSPINPINCIFFGLWGEAGVPGENPRRHRKLSSTEENIHQTVKKMLHFPALVLGPARYIHYHCPIYTLANNNH